MDRARAAQSLGDIARAVDAAREALDLAPDATEAMEFLALALVTRRRAYDEGLSFVDRAVETAPDDAGLWYTRGWCYEFAGHELRRRPRGHGLDPRTLYTAARESFQHCLALHPDGKLAGDAEDLLDHVENELRSL
jgi:tetratricopeptide (TPR) repeat protein